MNYEILYVYIKAGIFSKTEYAMDVVDSLKYNFDDFFSEIQNNLLLENNSSDDLSIINLFCICTSKDKALKIKNSLLDNILNKLSTSTSPTNDIYDKYISTYANYLLDNNLAPLIFSFDIDNLTVLYLFGSKEFYEEPPEEVREIVNIWYQKEKPAVFGKQILTQPFYYKTLIGRKVLDIISSKKDYNLYLNLEGNVKIKLDYSTITPLDFYDTVYFSAMDIQNILYNPVYCFGYYFEPIINLYDWFDVYLYILAMLDPDINNIEKLKKSYFDFLNFISEHICDKIYCKNTIIDEDTFFAALKNHIQNSSNFIKRKR